MRVFAILRVMQLKWDALTTRRKEAEILEALIGEMIAIEPLLLGDDGQSLINDVRVLHVGELLDIDEDKYGKPYAYIRITESYIFTDGDNREPQPTPIEPQIFYLEAVNGWSPILEP